MTQQKWNRHYIMGQREFDTRCFSKCIEMEVILFLLQWQTIVTPNGLDRLLFVWAQLSWAHLMWKYIPVIWWIRLSPYLWFYYIILNKSGLTLQTNFYDINFSVFFINTTFFLNRNVYIDTVPYIINGSFFTIKILKYY